MKKQNQEIEKLQTLINRLYSNEQLDLRYKDHPLTGNWKGYRDCHIEPDWLLIYQRTKDTLILARTGSHSDLFK